MYNIFNGTIVVQKFYQASKKLIYNDYTPIYNINLLWHEKMLVETTFNYL